MKLFINIYKSFYAKERDYRIHSILHPKFFLDVHVTRGEDNKRHEGWKYDGTYKIHFSNNPKWQNMIQGINYKQRLLVITNLLLVFTNSSKFKYKNLHSLISNSQTENEKNIVHSIFEYYKIDDECILDAGIAIDKILLKYFKNRLTIHNPLEQPPQANIAYCNIYIYCKVDFQRRKLRVLFGSKNILQNIYDGPVIPFMYESTPKNPMLANIIYTLQDKNYLEIMYRWMENILERSFSIEHAEGKYFLIQRDLEELITMHPKTDFFYNLLIDIHFTTMVLVMGQISKRIQSHLMKPIPTNEILATTVESLDSKKLIKMPIEINVYPTNIADRKN